jgi:hypothetical protein
MVSDKVKLSQRLPLGFSNYGVSVVRNFTSAALNFPIFEYAKNNIDVSAEIK